MHEIPNGSGWEQRSRGKEIWAQELVLCVPDLMEPCPSPLSQTLFPLPVENINVKLHEVLSRDLILDLSAALMVLPTSEREGQMQKPLEGKFSRRF